MLNNYPIIQLSKSKIDIYPSFWIIEQLEQLYILIHFFFVVFNE
jgi:hypothetical protein